jgi:hypothetical protein
MRSLPFAVFVLIAFFHPGQILSVGKSMAPYRKKK